MASEGPNNPGTSSATDGPDVDWTSSGSEFSSNDTYNTAPLNPSNKSETLLLTNFGFSIPSGATIDGIVVEIERSQTIDGIKDFLVKLYRDGIGVVGDNKADTSTSWPLMDGYATYGSSSDDWNASLTDTQINDATFGVAIQAENTSGVSTSTARIDHIRITVYYTEPVVEYEVDAESGEFTLAGQNAGLISNHTTAASSGAFVLAGQNAGTVHGHPMTAGAGSYVLTGQDAGTSHMTVAMMQAFVSPEIINFQMSYIVEVSLRMTHEEALSFEMSYEETLSFTMAD